MIDRFKVTSELHNDVGKNSLASGEFQCNTCSNFKLGSRDNIKEISALKVN